MKIGFLIIDMQAVHLQDIDKKAIDRACEYINYVSDILRSKNQVIIHVQDVEGISELNKDSFTTIPEVQMKDTDLVVTKQFSNAFWQTELDQLLAEQGVELLIISGTAAEHCVLFTYNGAGERGFKPVILQNAVLSKHSDAITSLYRDRNLISHPAISYLM
ncbi:isochorismatase family protein [Paenibacillus glycanilyticus]|uniref:cysteine hydrolase family protein n=1 Tax=Paenibacillus glycanilyticus TaxID=126569 RepID=UPI00203A72AF|nr:isochorismatase family protein [Paenibacillus glycanilyticus]MCM3628456.1 isochorismatase family protein [Paenibacillus glycanilyticus]